MDNSLNRKYYLHHFRAYSRKQVFDKTGGKCVYCGMAFKDEQDLRFTLEHLIPVSKGGMDEFKNVYPCCKQCNKNRGNHELAEWLDILVDKKHSYKGVYHITNRLDIMIANVTKLADM